MEIFIALSHQMMFQCDVVTIQVSAMENVIFLNSEVIDG